MDVDVHISKEELDKLLVDGNHEIEDIFPMEVDAECIQADSNKLESESFSRTLDICLLRIFSYLNTTCYNPDGSLL